jgi:hypothetical protein
MSTAEARPSRHALKVAGAVIVSFFFGPAVAAALQWWLGLRRAQDADALLAITWFAAFLAAGAFVGNAIAGRRGRFAFSVAFAVFPLVAIFVVGQSLDFHDNDYDWRPYENILDIALFNVAYPVAFAAMGSIGVGIVVRQWNRALTAAVMCGLAGWAGGVIFSVAVYIFHVHGYVEALSFATSLGIPAVLSTRRVRDL